MLKHNLKATNLVMKTFHKKFSIKNLKYSSYCQVDKASLTAAQVDTSWSQIKNFQEIDEATSKCQLIGINAKFLESPGIDLISEYSSSLIQKKHQIIDTEGRETKFTYNVPYIRTVAHPSNEISQAPLWHVSNLQSVQFDVYDIPDIKITENNKLYDTSEINLGSETDRNVIIRVSLFGKAAEKYDPVLFKSLCSQIDELRNVAREQLIENKKCLTIGVGYNESQINPQKFDRMLNIEWNTDKNNAWPRCVRVPGSTYVISQKSSSQRNIQINIPNKPTDKVSKSIYDTAINACNEGCEAIQSYKVQSSLALQMQEQAKWSTQIGLSLIMETCGIHVNDTLFQMKQINAEQSDEPLRVTSIGKGDGLPMMNSKGWETMFPPETLKGMSRSPMAVANSLLYNNIVYGNELGRLMGPVDNLFFYDYAIESRDKDINEWFLGVRQKIGTTLKFMTPLQATAQLGNIMAYEMIKAKASVEEVSRGHGQINHRMAVWKDLRAMLHYRVVDAAFLKIVPYTMLTTDEMDAIGLATVLHDMVDFGYDISVKESSNTFLTITEGKIDVESVKKGYVRMARGLQYIIQKYKHDACGLTFLSTHFWQIANGRHRIVPSIINGATEYEHNYLELKGNLLDVLNDQNDVKTLSLNTQSASQAAYEIRNAAAQLGPDAVAFAKILTEDLTQIYLGGEVSNEQVLKIERQLCELSVSLSIGCNPDGKMTDFMWMICEYMWLQTGMMMSCLTGSLKIATNRRQSDDRGGLDYNWQNIAIKETKKQKSLQ